MFVFEAVVIDVELVLVIGDVVVLEVVFKLVRLGFDVVRVGVVMRQE